MAMISRRVAAELSQLAAPVVAVELSVRADVNVLIAQGIDSKKLGYGFLESIRARTVLRFSCNTVSRPPFFHL
jgi:GTP cyclohydrolase III